MTDYTPPQPNSDALTAQALVTVAQTTQALVNVAEALLRYDADTDAALAEFSEIINPE